MNAMIVSKYKVLLVMFFSAWICSNSVAQETSAGNHPITKGGSLALEFDFGGLNTLSMPGVLIASFLFPGANTNVIPLYGAGVKYYLSDELALRAMVGFSTNTSGADSLPSGKSTGTFFGIGAGVEMHTHPVYAVSPYFGAQLVFASGSSDNTVTQFVGKAGGKSNTLATTTTDTKLSATGFGVGILAGFDWYIFSAVAIGCEYELNFESSSGSSTISGTTTTAPSSTAIGIGSANVHLLIHL